jgi:two-component system OmpR family response regulator
MEKDKDLCTVLVVEDDNDLCRILENVVGKLCPVHVEHDLHQARDYLENQEPTIILLDNNLPDGLGVKNIRHFRDLCPNAKIVLMTADTSAGLDARALQEGAVAFLAKPFRGANINELILSICPELRAA